MMTFSYLSSSLTVTKTYMMMVGWSMYEMSVQNRSQAALAICSISDDDGAAV